MDIATLGLKVDASGAIREVRNVSGELSGLGSVAKRAALAVGAAFATGAVFKKFVDETIIAQNAVAQLDAVLASTGGSAGRTSAELQAMASSLQGISVFGDDAVMSAQALLLTFTQIKGDQFDAATLAVANLAQAMGGDLRGAALQVGKALNDPATGLTALTRSGVSFSEAQKDLIKTLTETGKVAEAQTLILRELENQFGGSAAAARDTLGGALAGLRNAFGDLFELPKESTADFQAAIESLTTALVEFKKILDDGEVFLKVARELANIANAGNTVIKVTGEWTSQVGLLSDAYANAAGFIGNALTLDFDGARDSAERARMATDKLGDSVARVTRLRAEAAAGYVATRNGPSAISVGAGGFDTFAPVTPGGSGVDTTAAARALRAEWDKTRDAANSASEAMTEAFTKAASTGRMAVERQQALNAAIGESESVVDGINAAFALKAKLAEIDAQFTGRQAAELKALATALSDAEAESRLLTTAEAARQKAAEEAARSLADRTEALAQQADRVSGLSQETDALRAQVAAIQAGTTAYRDMIRAQEIEAAISAEQAKAKADGITVSDATIARIREEITERQRLAALLDAFADIGNGNPFSIPAQETADFANGLRDALTVAQALATVFGDVGSQIANAAQGLGNLVTGISQINKASSTQKTDPVTGVSAAVGLGGALTGAAGATTALSAVAGIGAVFVGVVGVLSAFRGKTAAEAKAMQREAAAFQDALRDFTEAAAGGVSGVLDAIRKREREADALRAEFIIPAKFRGKIDGLDRFVDGKVQEIDEALLKIIRGIGEDLLAGINSAFNVATGNEGANAIAQALSDYDARLKGLNEAFAAGAITQAEYAQGLFQAGVIQQQTLADIDKAAQKAAAAIARLNDVSIRDSDIRAQATSDPIGAARAQFFAEQADEMFDAIESNLSAAAIEALAFAQALEAIAFEAAQAEAALRITTGLIGRGLTATNDPGASQFIFDEGQRQELVDAILAGFTPFQQELLKFVQFAEREQFMLQRAIEDQTKVIRDAADEQIAAINEEIAAIRTASDIEQQGFRDQIDAVKANAATVAAAFQQQIDDTRAAAKAQTDAIDEQIRIEREAAAAQRSALQIAQAQLAVSTRAADALRTFAESLSTGQFSPLSPEAQLDLTRSRFETLTTAAQGGDADAAAQLPTAARELLEASRAFNASGPGFVSDFDRVSQITSELAATFGSQADAQQRIVSAAEAGLEASERAIEIMQAQKDAIQRDSQRIIDALTVRKNDAAQQARDEIAMLEIFAEAALAGAEEQIGALTGTIDAINEAADRQIAAMVNILTGLSEFRVQSHAFYGDFLTLTEQGITAEEETGSAQIEIAADSLVELKAVGAALKSGFAEMREDMARQRNIDVAASEAQVGLLRLQVERLTEIVSSQRLQATSPVRARV